MEPSSKSGTSAVGAAKAEPAMAVRPRTIELKATILKIERLEKWVCCKRTLIGSEEENVEVKAACVDAWW